MASTQIIVALACIISLVMWTEVKASTIEERFEAVKAEIDQLRNEKDSEISLLKNKIKGLKTEMQSMDSPTVFDCYLSEIWDTDGIIQFNGCDVDLTTGDPWKGSFTIPTEGLWHFSFNAGYVYFPSADDPYGYIYLKVDGTIVANSFTNPTDDGTASWFTMSLNTVQDLQVGQTVTIEWVGGNGASIVDDPPTHRTHWTGEYLGPSMPTPPECQSEGQTFEYPGSCRDYYLCDSNLVASKTSCCPDIYVAEAEACLPEEMVTLGEICPSEDTC